MEKVKGLSKSKYTLFCQCPKALWMNTYKSEEAVVDPSLQARFEMGNVVGDLAMELLGPYVDVTKYDSGKLDLQKMIDRTNECLRNGTENICEASFSYKSDEYGVNYCAVDILHKDGDGYAIYEVKSSTGNASPEKNKPEELEKYARDIAYQKWVLEKCGIKVTDTYLVRINSDYILDGELDIKELFHITDMKDNVANVSGCVPNNIKLANQILSQKDEPDHDIDICCHKPYPCAFAKYCSRHLPKNSVFDLYRIQFRTALKYYESGIVSFDDLISKKLHKPLTDKQQFQVDCTLQNKNSINKAGISEFLKKLSYPLYFLDFETEQPALPKFQGTKPYQQVPFQYSLHWIENEGGELKHTDFLGNGIDDPRRALAVQLCHDIPMNVCTTAYNKDFECGRIRELAAAFPDLSVHLLNIADNIVDLLEPFQAGYYYEPAMGGSFSIKKVLPALFPNDPELDYHNLEGDVHNGSEAMSIYPKMATMTPDELEKTRKALLQYCGLDTLAMVKIWEKLIEVSK